MGSVNVGGLCAASTQACEQLPNKVAEIVDAKLKVASLAAGQDKPQDRLTSAGQRQQA
jgi:hypothetical protein